MRTLPATTGVLVLAANTPASQPFPENSFTLIAPYPAPVLVGLVARVIAQQILPVSRFPPTRHSRQNSGFCNSRAVYFARTTGKRFSVHSP